MTVLVDTGVLFAEYDTDAARHEDARRAHEALLSGEFGRPFVTEYVFDETVTLTRTRTGSQAAAVDIGRRILGHDPYEQVYKRCFLDAADFEAAWTVFREYDDQALSFTDATTIACLERREIDNVLSFDDDFDGLVPRIDPREMSSFRNE